MDWLHPHLLLWFLPLAALVWVAQHRRGRPMSLRRRRGLLALRLATLLVLLLALAAPARRVVDTGRSVLFVLDHSQSIGSQGVETSARDLNEILTRLPEDTEVGIVSAGASPRVLRPVGRDRRPFVPDPALASQDGEQTNLAAALSLATGLFPAGRARHVVLLSDGVETQGDVLAAARSAAVQGIVIDTRAVQGPVRPDARVVRLRSSRARSPEGAPIALTAELESSISGSARLRLFENGIEVESRAVALEAGVPRVETFRRTPEASDLYRYLVRLEGVREDVLPENDEAMALVEVQGRPLFLLIEGAANEARHLRAAMATAGLVLEARAPEAFPDSLEALSAYDGVVFCNVPAPRVGEQAMVLLYDYVERLGGGFAMIGGPQSFGLGGYERTPIEYLLPVRLQPPDKEERYATALCLVLDRSGSMGGLKIEICKSAAIATAEMLTPKDFLGVVAFDSAAHWIVPMTRADEHDAIRAQISRLNAGGGTNIQPGMLAARTALQDTPARVKHMIVLSDGRSAGGSYRELAAQCLAADITVSTVGVGEGADNVLLADIAQAGGGKHYATADPGSIPRIFSQDAATHLRRLVREGAFQPQQVEAHPMLAGWRAADAPTLLGYVKTERKPTGQVPLVTDKGDPLLATWRFGLGTVTAFTSDCSARWAASWIGGWPGYSQFWGQVLRDLAPDIQNRTMDLRLTPDPKGVRLLVDRVEDAARYEHAAEVTAEVSFVPRRALGSAPRRLGSLRLDQVGSGRYEGTFPAVEAGVYLVRARSGSDLVSARWIREVSSESTAGHVDAERLAQVAALTGGVLLRAPTTPLSTRAALHTHYEDWSDALLALALFLFLCDLCLRRRDNVLALWEAMAGRLSRRR
jgi:Ca-activated chloride channel family protein